MNILLTGLPRSGTTLACKLLSDQEQTIGLNEPVALGQCNSIDEVIKATDDFVLHTRASLIEKGEAINKVGNKGIVTNHFADKSTDGQRKKLVSRQVIKFDKGLKSDFRLIIKHNAGYTVALPKLIESYPMYAMIRHPLDVLLSWNSVPIPVSKGRLRKNFMSLLPENELFEHPDVHVRQVALLDWYLDQYKKWIPERIIRYEDMIQSQGEVLSRMTYVGWSAKEELKPRNRKNYDDHLVEKLKSTLDQFGRMWKEFYSFKNSENE